MSRARQYNDNAERQRAYRERKRNGQQGGNVTRNVTNDEPLDWPSVDELLDQGASAAELIEALSLYFTPDEFVEFAKALDEGAERRRYPSLWAAIDEERALRLTKRNKATVRH